MNIVRMVDIFAKSRDNNSCMCPRVNGRSEKSLMMIRRGAVRALSNHAKDHGVWGYLSLNQIAFHSGVESVRLRAIVHQLRHVHVKRRRSSVPSGILGRPCEHGRRSPEEDREIETSANETELWTIARTLVHRCGIWSRPWEV